MTAKEFKTFALKHQNNVAILKLQSRRIYMQLSEDFREEINQFLNSGESKVIVDLSNVHVMNSTGLGVLIAMQSRLESTKGKLFLVGLQPLMQEIFSRMKLEMLFKTESSVEQALQHLQK